MAISKSNIFAATGTGVFHSSDNGRSWSGVSSSLPDHTFNTVAVSGNTVYAGAYFDGVFKSTDNGTSWKEADGNLPLVRINAIAAGSSTVFAGTNTQGIYVSTDAGATWTQADSGLPSNDTEIDQFAISGNNSFAIASDGFNASLWRSTDNGKSWVSIDDSVGEGTAGQSSGGIAVSGSNVYALGGSGVIVSTDNGSTWMANDKGLPVNANIYEIAASGWYVFAATDSGLFSMQSSSSGWTAVTEYLLFSMSPEWKISTLSPFPIPMCLQGFMATAMVSVFGKGPFLKL